MRTAVCELLGIDQPIVQAPIARFPGWLQRSRMQARSAMWR